MKNTSLKMILLAICFGPAPVLAGAAEGVWKTGADAKGQIAYVTARRCGPALCGQITEVLSPQGQRIDHPNVGRKVFWDMRETGAGNYQGRAFVPALGRDYAATMKVSGQKMTVRGCFGPVCKSQIWTRLK